MTKVNTKVLEAAVKKFIQLREEAAELTKMKDEASDAVKALLGDSEEVDLPDFSVTYKYDADKVVETIDTEKLKREFPKTYHVVVTKKTVTGSRRLIVKAVKEE